MKIVPERLACALLLSTSLAGAHEAAAPLRGVTVMGEGEVQIQPDRARLVLGVEKLDPDLKKAEAEVNRIVSAYLTAAKSLGAKDEHLSTGGVSLQPEYDWSKLASGQKLLGYRVSRRMEIRIDPLDRLGDFILRATQAGVNRIEPPVLESSQARELERQALVQAAEDAREKARRLAETLGARLGAAQRITESGGNDSPVPYRGMVMQSKAADGNAEMGMALGEIRYRATVSVEFDLLPR
ncbi:MAG: SIMPL domain-containing protein [Nevskiales bacterium]|nr:SIMPL domain-containing protein [Nevskiales bacterium]